MLTNNKKNERKGENYEEIKKSNGLVNDTGYGYGIILDSICSK